MSPALATKVGLGLWERNAMSTTKVTTVNTCHPTQVVIPRAPTRWVLALVQAPHRFPKMHGVHHASYIQAVRALA